MRRAAAAVLAAVVAILGDAGAVRAAEVLPGSGMASAVVARVGPVGDNLSFVVAWGESLADYQGSSATGQSAVADFGLLGLFLTTPICPHTPPPLDKKYLPPMTRADSGSAGSEQGKHAALATTPDAPANGGAGDERVWATQAPVARAQTTLASFGADPRALGVVGGRSDAHTGTTADGREAAASSSIDELDVLGGLVRLEGLRWDVVQHSDTNGKVDRTVGTFHLAGAAVQGQAVPLDPKADAGAQVDAVNKAIAPTGMTLVAPVVSVRDGVVSVTPLGLRMTDSPGARATVAPLLTAVQPVRQPLADAVTKQSCSASLAIEAFDIMTDAMAGNGGMVLELGGVAATTEAGRFPSPFLAIPRVAVAGAPASPETVTPNPSAQRQSALGSPGSPGTPGRAAVPGRALPAGRLVGGTRTLPGGAGGAAAVAMLAALLLLVVLATGDRRRMRSRTSRSS